MNIKINKELSKVLFDNTIESHIMGSRLYGTNREDSDTDILVIYKSIFSSDLIYPNYHQFQYDEDNTQYIFTSERMFWYNLNSGDSIINVDIILKGYKDIKTDEQKLNVLRTYNIIKALIGFTKRDIKNYSKGIGKNKLFHINRCFYYIESLLDNKLPDLTILKDMVLVNDIELFIEKEKYFREKCNNLFFKNELTLYSKDPIGNNYSKLELLLINANNIREFRYD